MLRARLSRRIAAPLLLLLGLFVVSGCGGSSRAGVEGKVTFNGSPLEAGMISFLVEADRPDSGHAAITDGKYALAADKGPPPGTYRVEITWNKPEAKPKDPDIVRTVQVIPQKYNLRSQLKADLKPGMNTCDFELVGTYESGAPTQQQRKPNLRD